MCLQSSNQLVVVVVVVLVFGARGLGEVAGVFFVLEEDGGAAGVAEVVLAGLWSQLGCSGRVVMFSNLNPPFNLHTPPDLGGLLLFFHGCSMAHGFQWTGLPECANDKCWLLLRLKPQAYYLFPSQGTGVIIGHFLLKTCNMLSPPWSWIDTICDTNTDTVLYTIDFTIHITYLTMRRNNMAAEWSSMAFVLSPFVKSV